VHIYTCTHIHSYAHMLKYVSKKYVCWILKIMGHQKPSAEITHNCIFFLRSHSHIYPNNRTHIFVHTFMFLCTLTSIRTYMSVRTPSHIYLDTCMHVFTFSGCLESWVTRLYIYLGAHTYTYIQTHALILRVTRHHPSFGAYIYADVYIYICLYAHTLVYVSQHIPSCF